MDRREQKDGINEATFVTIKKRKAAKNPNAAEGERNRGWDGSARASGNGNWHLLAENEMPADPSLPPKQLPPISRIR